MCGACLGQRLHFPSFSGTFHVKLYRLPPSPWGFPSPHRPMPLGIPPAPCPSGLPPPSVPGSSKHFPSGSLRYFFKPNRQNFPSSIDLRTLDFCHRVLKLKAVSLNSTLFETCWPIKHLPLSSLLRVVACSEILFLLVFPYIGQVR